MNYNSYTSSVCVAAYLDMLLKSGKNVYVNYGHQSYGEWSLILACLACDDENAMDEIKGIKGYMKDHPGIKGFAVRNLEPDVSIKKYCAQYSITLKNYNVLHFIR